MNRILTALGVAALVSGLAGTGLAGDHGKHAKKSPKTEKECKAHGGEWNAKAKKAKRCTMPEAAAAKPAEAAVEEAPAMEDAAPAENADGGSY